MTVRTLPVPGSPEARVLAALTGEPPTIHDLSTATGYPVAVVFRILVRLRAAGHRVIAVPDGTLTRFTVLEVAYSLTEATDTTIDNGDMLSATE